MKRYHQKKSCNVSNMIVGGFITLCLLILGACSQTQTTQDETDTEVKREDLQVTINSMTFDKEEKEVTANLSTNIPDGTSLDFTLLNSKEEAVTFTFDKQVQDGKVTPVFSIEQGYEIDKLIAGDYKIISKIDVIGDTNTDFNYDSNFGGEYGDLAEQYKDSKLVTIEEGDEMFDYTVTVISSNKLAIGNLYTTEEKAQIDAAQEEEYKQEYVMDMKDHASQMQEQFNTFSTLFANPQFDSMDWKVDLSVVITEITRLSKEPENYYVPQEYEKSHAIYLEAMKEYQIAMEKLPSALDSMDADGLKEVMNHMNNALAKVKKVHEMLDNL